METRTSTPCRRLGIAGRVVLLVAAFTGVVSSTASASSGARKVLAVGAENEYANVIAQIGGPYVSVSAILSNPNADPHSFEASPKVAQLLSSAQLVVQNGLGYDAFMNDLEAAAPNPTRRVIDVQTLLGMSSLSPNPHLWYRPATMPAVAKAVAADLSALDPAHRSYFTAALARFDASLQPLDRAISTLRTRFAHAAVATTEPVADYLLQAAGLDIATPWTLQADIMNGVDPSPQDVTFEEHLLSAHLVKAFLYNEQVTDSLTETFLQLAHSHSVPVVAVYETMPTPGFTYQTWMLAEVSAITAAIAHGHSTTKLG